MKEIREYLKSKRSNIHQELEFINKTIIEEEKRNDEFRNVPELTSSQKAKVRILAKHHFLGGQVEVLDEILEILDKKISE